MSAQHSHDLSIKVGEYQSGSETKSRNRNIGRVFTAEDGRLFIRIHAEALNPILASMARRKGEDSVILNLWPAEGKPKANGDKTAAEDDDIPY